MANLEELTGGGLSKLISDVSYQYQMGFVSRDEAERMAEPIIREMNRRGEIIARRYRRKFFPFTFEKLMG